MKKKKKKKQSKAFPAINDNDTDNDGRTWIQRGVPQGFCVINRIPNKKVILKYFIDLEAAMFIQPTFTYFLNQEVYILPELLSISKKNVTVE